MPDNGHPGIGDPAFYKVARLQRACIVDNINARDFSANSGKRIQNPVSDPVAGNDDCDNDFMKRYPTVETWMPPRMRTAPASAPMESDSRKTKPIPVELRQTESHVWVGDWKRKFLQNRDPLAAADGRERKSSALEQYPAPETATWRIAQGDDLLNRQHGSFLELRLDATGSDPVYPALPSRRERRPTREPSPGIRITL